jgi:hypothetical protein
MLIGPRFFAASVMPSTTLWVGLTLAIGIQAPAQPPRSDSLRRSATLAGVVRETSGQPIWLATVRVVGKELSAVSDDSGRFRLVGIPAGVNEFVVARIGYDSVSFTVTLAPDTTISRDLRLRPIHVLEAVRVAETPVSRRFARTGFHMRRKLGVGSFVTPERVDSLSWVARPSQLLRDVGGIDVVQGVVSSRWARCMWLFIDGVPYGTDQIDLSLTTGVIYAIEVYPRPTSVPAEFQGRLTRASGRFTARSQACGALVVWTHSRAR